MVFVLSRVMMMRAAREVDVPGHVTGTSASDPVVTVDDAGQGGSVMRAMLNRSVGQIAGVSVAAGRDGAMRRLGYVSLHQSAAVTPVEEERVVKTVAVFDGTAPV